MGKVKRAPATSNLLAGSSHAATTEIEAFLGKSMERFQSTSTSMRGIAKQFEEIEATREEVRRSARRNPAARPPNEPAFDAAGDRRSNQSFERIDGYRHAFRPGNEYVQLRRRPFTAQGGGASTSMALRGQTQGSGATRSTVWTRAHGTRRG